MEFMSISSIKYDKKANLKKRLSNRDFAEKFIKVFFIILHYGAGAVVTKDVLPYTVVAGIPARILK